MSPTIARRGLAALNPALGQHVGDQLHGESDYVGEASVDPFDERVAAILLSIVFLVLISEAISAWARARVMKMK